MKGGLAASALLSFQCLGRVAAICLRCAVGQVCVGGVGGGYQPAKTHVFGHLRCIFCTYWCQKSLLSRS